MNLIEKNVTMALIGIPFKKDAKGVEPLELAMAEVENQLNRKIKIVRLDGGEEYYGKHSDIGEIPEPFSLYCQKNRIVNQFTMPYTPKQNGVAERQNRTLMDSGSGERSIDLNEKLIDALNKELSIPLYMENTTIVPSDEVDILVVDAPPYDVNPNPLIIQQPLQRAERTRRSVVHDDFITYLNKDDYDLVDHDGKWIETEKEDNPEEIRVVSFYPRQEPIEPLEWQALENWLNPSITEPLKLELKELLEHLEYAFLQENKQLCVVISSALAAHKKTKLLEVLKEDIIGLPPLREKFLRPNSIGLISFMMHENWSKVTTRVSEPTIFLQGMKHPKCTYRDMKGRAIELCDEKGNEFIVNKQRVKPYQKDISDFDADDDVTLDDEGVM
uniref:Putative zinc finger, CCHC-type n=1 Tax=Tanacetum cinerariifolium TaxID=118510 RepID=A0A6L2KU77_TANCI|nr:putative zinc finger, CCHC-type [Tanacetum cinerariifolium]